jgi:hypothetical protein
MHAQSDDARTPLDELPEGERLFTRNKKGDPRAGVPDPAPPPGARVGWVKFEADNRDGWVWQDRTQFLLGSNADQFRMMGPTARYPLGYVRYTNSSGQPIDVLGKPTGRDATHFAITERGQYGTPEGWH